MVTNLEYNRSTIICVALSILQSSVMAPISLQRFEEMNIVVAQWLEQEGDFRNEEESKKVTFGIFPSQLQCLLLHFPPLNLD